ncbi:putative ras-related protein rab-18 [Triangularia setosa]|uniref:Ras-related protein rab-18 n=1 Tax=Triangularia setosa TaxID=2587417 RepID=A0AAN6VYI7_9PEZI|nr:putative ras-related protein rab-18 [Podospora setosa]
MASDDTLPTLKVLLIGPSGAGKSALLTRYCDDEFDPETSAATIGIDFKERFRTLSTSFYRGAHGVLLVYDISTRASFLSMERWFNEAEANTVEGVALYLVGAKLDKADGPDGGREVTTEEGQALAEAHGAKFCEASAKTRENVRLPFVDIVDKIVQTPGLIQNARLGRAAGAVALGTNNGSGGYGAYLPGGCSC